jgi:AcrR family transcriptional regulator
MKVSMARRHDRSGSGPSAAPAAPEPLARVLFSGSRLDTPVPVEDNPTRRRILAAAIAVFAEQGYRGAATRVIAARAGLAEKTLFAHYGSKAALFAAAMSEGLDAMMGARAVAELAGELAQGGTLEERLLAVARNRVRFAGENLHLVKAIFQEILLDPEFREGMRARFVQRLLPAARMAIALGVRTGRLREVEAERVIRMLVSLVAGYVVTRYILVPERAWDDDAELRLMIDTLLRGLAPEQGPGHTGPSGDTGPA